MQFSWWTFAFQLVNVLILLWLLNLFLFRPVAGLIAERKAETQRLLDEADASKKTAQEAAAAANAERESIAAERARLLEAARADADGERRALFEKAKEDARQAVAKATDEVKRALEEERRHMVRDIGMLAVAIARKALSEAPPDALNAVYAERLIGVLQKLGPEQAELIAPGAGEMKLVAAAPLTEEQKAVYLGRLGPLLSRPADLPVEVDESLIAGLELHSAAGVIHNSLAFDLERIAEAMASDERS